jgi:glycosyltransferase involved in cell wall biosynthesis
MSPHALRELRELATAWHLPRRYTRWSAWHEHIPFAMYAVGAFRPRVLVELGAHAGDSYCAFCQAVMEGGLETRCYAIDTWEGDPHTGFYGAQVLEELKKYHDPLYGHFSTLVKATFDAAVELFRDGEIDLLHVDGYHTYEAVGHDFAVWLPKLSRKGIVLLHDTQERRSDFGTWRFWEELKERFPHFEFTHGHGLGVLIVGEEAPEAARRLAALSDDDAEVVREFFSGLGHRVSLLARQSALQEDLIEVKSRLAEHEAKIRELTDQLAVASQEIALVQASEAWKMGLALSKIGGWIFPEGSIQKGTLVLGWRALRIAHREGLGGLLKRIRSRGLRSIWHQRVQMDNYGSWIAMYDAITESDRRAIRAHIRALPYKPLISVIMPVCDPREEHLRAAIDSVRKQLYPNWELCIADDASSNESIRQILRHYAKIDTRIRVVFRAVRGHISAASNSALEVARGDFVALLDHDDQIPEHALYMVAVEVNEHPDAVVIYTDEDKLDEKGERLSPYFKCDWNPDLFYGQNMITHLGVYRADLVRQVGGFREGFEGSQDYDLALRVVELVRPGQVRHIPHVLYHWRITEGSAALDLRNKSYAHEAARKALQSHFNRCGINAQSIPAPGYPYFHRALFTLPSDLPLVTVIIPTRNAKNLLERAVAGVRRARYDRVELIIVDNQSDDPETLAYLSDLRRSGVTILSHDQPFNWSALNNFAASQARGDVLLFLNNDVEPLDDEWLEEMVRHISRPEVAVVGAALYYPDGRLQHGGVLLGLGGVAGHAHHGFPMMHPGYFGRAVLVQNFSAVTGACMATRKNVFLELGGFDAENLPVSFNDVDYCLRVRERGYRVVWTPYARLYHLEGASRGRGSADSPRHRLEIDYMRRRWGHLLESDPYYNPNLTLDRADFSLAWPPRAMRPWKVFIGPGEVIAVPRD